MKVMMIEESLYEFAKRGRPRKGSKKSKRSIGGIDSTDNWGAEEDEDMIDPDELDVDVSDMTDVETIEIPEDVFDNKLMKALSNEIKMIEPARANVRFKLKSDLSKVLNGIPMAKLGGNAFLFKLKNGSMKKIYLRDMIMEEEKSRYNRAKIVSEDFE